MYFLTDLGLMCLRKHASYSALSLQLASVEVLISQHKYLRDKSVLQGFALGSSQLIICTLQCLVGNSGVVLVNCKFGEVHV